MLLVQENGGQYLYVTVSVDDTMGLVSELFLVYRKSILIEYFYVLNKYEQRILSRL